MAIVFNPASRSPDDLLSKLSDAGLSVAVVTVAGAFATGFFKVLDERQLRDQERRKVFHELIDEYNQVKGVRRGLAALGVHKQRTRSLSSDETKELRAAMAKLNDAQLRFEAIKREVEQSNLFRRNADVARELREVEHFINRCVLDKWENYGGDIWEDASPSVLGNLGLATSMTAGFKSHVKQPLDRLTNILHEELFGRPGVWRRLVERRQHTAGFNIAQQTGNAQDQCDEE
ncbi:hypothetical protein [Pseudonocardia cypriaca]|uniref:hypothetical protein n=1 Tax=Pseudonocardia cypriaca TaxID=882449 RepID=UPI00114EB60B|nr:hypothetical protein [Pseudonocardia cypriaca]